MKIAEYAININVPSDIVERLDAIASKQFTTRSEIARSFLIDALYQSNSEKEFVYFSLSTWVKAVKERDGNKCSACGATGKLQAHHKRPVARGGGNTINNGITLCMSCHALSHKSVTDTNQERIPVGLKLPKWLVEWLRAQPESMPKLIVDALIEENKLQIPALKKV